MKQRRKEEEEEEVEMKNLIAFDESMTVDSNCMVTLTM